MKNKWNQDKVQEYIDDKIQENLTLDYKAADALQKKDDKKKEITKDVSAMANSAGGIIIYGVREYKDKDLSFFPESIDPISQSQITKEWLQQVINTIRPKIDGIVITPIQIDRKSDLVVYVVEVPQSTTAHQATDYRYYKRYNSISSPMEDYEIRDIMGRQKFPTFDVFFKVNKRVYIKRISENIYGIPLSRSSEEEVTEYSLSITIKNIGYVLANYVNVFIKIPSTIVPEEEKIRKEIYENTEDTYIEYSEDNTVRDVVDYNTLGLSSIPKYGPSRYDPILPRLEKEWVFELDNQYESLNKGTLEICWEIYADNANPLIGKERIRNIEISVKDETK